VLIFIYNIIILILKRSYYIKIVSDFNETIVCIIQYIDGDELLKAIVCFDVDMFKAMNILYENEQFNWEWEMNEYFYSSKVLYHNIGKLNGKTIYAINSILEAKILSRAIIAL